ncbi:DNA methyltransferase [Helicobacter suis]|uniref:DNA methyltransferase n=1 Tax=Helicobacter suis TaxID=104628 RepID=UPI0013D3590A|nr:DNA methyltransferase [Helicobacter suis]
MGNAEGKYDKRNTLNDLTGKEWLKLTSSFWFSEKCGLDKEAFKHPAPFLVKDIEKLIKLFTKKRMTILDPFCGSGTSLIAAYNLERYGIGFDLSKEYYQLAKNRLSTLGAIEHDHYQYILGHNLDLVKKLQEDSIDYVVTSPPYYNILKNKSEGIRSNKSIKGYRNGARLGIVSYNNSGLDLENLKTYGDFLKALYTLFGGIKRILKGRRYCSIVISDFTVNKKETNVVGDVIRLMVDCGYEFCGNVALIQENKPLYPFGYPFAYKINHHNQNILNFRK